MIRLGGCVFLIRVCALAFVVAACNFDHGALVEPDAPSETITVSFDTAATMVDEATGTVDVPVTLSAASTQTVKVAYAVTGGTALRPDDFSLTDGTLTFTPGQTEQSIAVFIVSDALEESDETIELALSQPVGAMLGATATHTLTISADILPRASFVEATASSADEGTSPQVEVRLDLPPKTEVTVELGVAGTASDSDRGVTDGQVITFAANQMSQLVPLGVVQDALDEDDETIELTLQNPSGGLLLAPADTTRTHTIEDDDPLPSVGFASASVSTNESQSVDLTVQLSEASGRTVSVAYAVTFGTATPADASVTGAPGTVTFMPGETTKTIAVAVTNDSLDEANETLTVTLANPSNATLGTAATTVTIVDNDDPPTVAFAQATASVNEAMTTVNLTVQLSAASGRAITVPFSIAGASTADGSEDYTLVTSPPLVFMPGVTSATIAIDIDDDALDEANETVIVVLGTPTNATLGAIAMETLTINDNDPTPTVAFTSSGSMPNEGDSNITLTLQLSDISGQDVTIPYTIDAATTATNPADYTITPASPIVIPAGQTSTTITIAMKEDMLDEPDETVIVVLGMPTNATLAAPSTYTLTIRDDDP